VVVSARYWRGNGGMATGGVMVMSCRARSMGMGPCRGWQPGFKVSIDDHTPAASRTSVSTRHLRAEFRYRRLSPLDGAAGSGTREIGTGGAGKGGSDIACPIGIGEEP